MDHTDPLTEEPTPFRQPYSDRNPPANVQDFQRNHQEKQEATVNKVPEETKAQDDSNGTTKMGDEIQGKSAPSIHDDVLRADPTRYGQAYSERNPPPNVQAFQQQQRERQEASRRFLEKQQAGDKPTEKDTTQAQTEGDPTGHEAPTEDDEARAGATADVPIGAEKSNVLFHPTPNIQIDRVFDTLHKDAMQIGYVISAAIVILDWLFIGGGE